MGLTWLWSAKCGEAVRRQSVWNENKGWEERDFTFSLYQGNACMIFVYRYENDKGEKMYQVNDFWADETHMKRCLGIDKKYKDTYGDNNEKDVIKYTFYRDKIAPNKLKKIVGAIAEAYDNIEIIITQEGNADGK